MMGRITLFSSHEHGPLNRNCISVGRESSNVDMIVIRLDIFVYDFICISCWRCSNESYRVCIKVCHPHVGQEYERLAILSDSL
jgi:hypothetical protein